MSITAHDKFAEVSALRVSGLLGASPSPDEVKSLFKNLDANNDGVVDAAELKKGLADNGVGDEEIAAMFRQADVDGDGKVDVNEFLQHING